MNLTKLTRLDAALRAVCPILGVAVPNIGSPVGVRIDFAVIATPQQKTNAQVVLDAFNWSDASDATYEARQAKAAATASIDTGQLQSGVQYERLVRALALVVLDEINLIRANFTPAMTARTAAQLVAAIKTKIASTAE